MTCLLPVAKVHLISYVGGCSRKKQVLKDMQRLPKYGDLASTRAIFTQVGENGKVDWACHLAAQ